MYSYEREQQRLLALLEESDMQDGSPPVFDDESDNDDIDDIQIDDVEVHDTDSEQDISEGENEYTETVSTFQNEEEHTIRTRLCYKGQGE